MTTSRHQAQEDDMATTQPTQDLINDSVSRLIAQQWLGSPKNAETINKAQNRDQLAKGLRILQKEGYLGARSQGEHLYYYLRTPVQAACARSWHVLAKQVAKHKGGEISIRLVTTICEAVEHEIEKGLKGMTLRPRVFPALVHLLQEKEPLSLAHLPGVEDLVAQVQFVEATEAQDMKAPLKWEAERIPAAQFRATA